MHQSRARSVAPGALDFSLCRRHATIARLQVVPIWLPPELRMLRREKHRDANHQLPLPFERYGQSMVGPAWLNARLNLQKRGARCVSFIS